jgi:LysM repeat protein
MNQTSLPRTAYIRSFLFALLLTSPAFALTLSDIESLRAKAEKGNAIAQYNLGLAYADRTGPAYDPVQAYVWLNVAAANGATGKALETITAAMSPSQLADANKRLASPRSEPAALADSPISAASPILPVQDPAAEAEKKQLSEELASSWREADRIKSALTVQLADANKRLAITESALANKDKALSALQARLDATSAPAANPAEFDLLRRERDQLRAAFAKAENDRLSLQAALADANKDTVAAQNAQRLAESETASLKSTADKVSAERLSLAAQLETANGEAARLRGELEAAKSNPNAKALADAQDELSSLKSASGGLSATGIAVLKADRDHFADTVAALTKERDGLAQQLADAKTAAAAVPAAPAVADTEVSTARLANLEKAKVDADAKLDAALRTYTLNQAEIDRLQKALANIDGERATLSDKLDAANKELAALRPQAEATASSAEKVAALGTQLADTQKTLAERTASLDQAVRDMTNARQIAETSTNDLAAVREQLRQTQAQAAANANEALNLKTRLALAGAGAGSAAPTRTTTIAPAAVTLATPMFTPPAASAATAPAPAKTAPAATEPRTHVVTAGDSLYSIAKHYYGSAGRWTEILAANRDIITNPNALALGTKLRIP